MSKDPIVEEVRKIREQHAKQFNYDLRAIVDDLRAHQERSGRKYVRFEPRRPPPGKEEGGLNTGSRPREGGRGHDSMSGGRGSDHLLGEEGDDEIAGGAGTIFCAVVPERTF